MPTGDTTDVTATLTDLERKLVDLERELGAVAAGGPASPRPVASVSVGSVMPPVADAGLRVEDLRGEIADLVRFRDQLEAAARELVTEYDRLVSRLRLPGAGAGAALERSAAPTQPAAAVAPPMQAAPVPDPLPPAVAAGMGHPPAPAPAPSPAIAQPPPAPSGADEHRTFAGAVEVDAGPFGDIATLQAFEQALAGVDGAEDVYVKSFEGNRALIDVRLSNPVPLVRQLRERLSLPMITREARDDRVTVDVQPREPHGT
jgi:ribonuclease E